MKAKPNSGGGGAKPPVKKTVQSMREAVKTAKTVKKTPPTESRYDRIDRSINSKNAKSEQNDLKKGIAAKRTSDKFVDRSYPKPVKVGPESPYQKTDRVINSKNAKSDQKMTQSAIAAEKKRQLAVKAAAAKRASISRSGGQGRPLPKPSGQQLPRAY